MPSEVKEGAMNSHMINMRKTYYIKKDFQKRFILEYLALVIFGAAVANLMLYKLLDKGIDDAFYRAHIGITTTGDVVRSPLVLTNLAVLFASIAAISAFTFMSSWKIGSRLNSLAKGIEGLKNADLTVQVESREGEDQFIELAGTFNKAVRQLNRKITSIKDEVKKIDEAVSGLEESRTNAIEQILRKVEAIEGHLSTFKLSQ